MLISIGKNLRKLRLEKGLTQEQLAEELGVSPQAVSRWENDGACPDVTLLPALAIFYETSIDALMGMDEIRSAERKRQVHCQVHALVSAVDLRTTKCSSSKSVLPVVLWLSTRCKFSLLTMRSL